MLRPPFAGLVGTIIFLLEKKTISVQVAGLMFVGLLAVYFGFGILIAVYRFMDRFAHLPSTKDKFDDEEEEIGGNYAT